MAYYFKIRVIAGSGYNTNFGVTIPAAMAARWKGTKVCIVERENRLELIKSGCEAEELGYEKELRALQDIRIKR